MQDLIILEKKDIITSLELLEQINFFRKEEGKKKDLRHDTLRDIIKDEFEEEILSQNILEKAINSNGGRPIKLFELTLSQAKQVLVRESKFVRKAVIHKLEELEKQLKKEKVFPIKQKLLLNIVEANTETERAVAINNYEIKYVKPLEIENKQQKEYIDHVVINKKYYITASQIGNKFDRSAKSLNKILNDIGIIYKRGKKWYLTSEYYGIADYRYFQKPNGDWEKGDNLCYSNEGEKLIFEILIAHGYEPVKVA